MVGLALEFRSRVWNSRFWCALGDAFTGPRTLDADLEIAGTLEP
jgi:hypothetical protein